MSFFLFHLSLISTNFLPAGNRGKPGGCWFPAIPRGVFHRGPPPGAGFKKWGKPIWLASCVTPLGICSVTLLRTFNGFFPHSPVPTGCGAGRQRYGRRHG